MPNYFNGQRSFNNSSFSAGRARVMELANLTKGDMVMFYHDGITRFGILAQACSPDGIMEVTPSKSYCDPTPTGEPNIFVPKTAG